MHRCFLWQRHTKNIEIFMATPWILFTYPRGWVEATGLVNRVSPKTPSHYLLLRELVSAFKTSSQACIIKRRSEVVGVGHARVPLSFLKSKASSLSVTISFMLMMLLWLSCLRILISRMAVMGKPSFSLSSRTFFRATISARTREKQTSRNTHMPTGKQ